eukprot:TRINITY_DN686_c0_g1_i1.p1 TRINITY_DN686_c0_g1~~TRINITY_DN686_c0_g1_i1.p1  ORF type:complete len:303 (-),score=62.92 TRINITY_DN686_c0_g1_i1:263-1087(-)
MATAVTVTTSPVSSAPHHKQQIKPADEDCLRRRLQILTGLPSSPRDPLQLRHLPAKRLTQLAQEASLPLAADVFQKLISDLNVQLSSSSTELKSSISETKRILKTFASAVTPNDWERYVHFSDTHYTRNLVIGTEDFELMVICWKNGQRSRIHNHAGSSCFVTCLQGPLTENFYKNFLGKSFETNDPDRLLEPVGYDEKEIQFVSKRDLNTSDVGFINDKAGLHAMSAEKGDCVTLHLYSPPIRVATVIEPENALVFQRLPGFWSVAGLVIAFD